MMKWEGRWENFITLAVSLAAKGPHLRRRRAGRHLRRERVQEKIVPDVAASSKFQPRGGGWIGESPVEPN